MLTFETVQSHYIRAESIVRSSNMVCESYANDDRIQIDMDQVQLIESIRVEARTGNIRMGSVESAVYHMLNHSVNPIQNYVLMANQLIADESMHITINPGTDFIDITFLNPNNSDSCVVLVKNGRMLLKTFIPKISKQKFI